MDDDYRKWTAGSLVITSSTTSVEEISHILNREPSTALRLGEQLSRGNPNSAIADHNMWSLNTDLPDDVPVEDHIEALLDFTKGREAALDELAKSCSIHFFLGFGAANGQGGFFLDHTLLLRLAGLPITVALDLYPPSKSYFQDIAGRFEGTDDG